MPKNTEATPKNQQGAPEAALTPRARRTRKALLEAAQKVFERDGFHNARITDIADTAGVAHGTFYTYFGSKETIFLALVDGFLSELLFPPSPNSEKIKIDSFERLKKSNRDYLEIYRDYGRIIAIWEELAKYNKEAAEKLKQGEDAFILRARRKIEQLQRDGLADPDIDARYAARALTGMVHKFADTWFSKKEDFEFEQAIEQLSLLWANALRMKRT